MRRARWLLLVVVASVLLADASALWLYRADVDAGDRTVEAALRTAPDLGLTNPFAFPEALLPLSVCAAAVAIAILLLVTRTRACFALAAAWSAVAIGVLFSQLVPLNGWLHQWRVDSTSPEILAVAVAFMSAACLAASILGWAWTAPSNRVYWWSVTPAGRRLMPPQSHQN